MKLRLATHHLEKAPAIVFEELEEGKINHVQLGSLSLEGLAHPSRIDFVKKWHVVMPSSCQVYVTKRAHQVSLFYFNCLFLSGTWLYFAAHFLFLLSCYHQTPHCSLFSWEVGEFRWRMKKLGRDCDIIVYDPDRSYTQDSNFVRVWNHHTTEFQGIESLFHCFDFETINSSLISRSASPAECGNLQVALGFSCQNLANRCPLTSVAVPGINEGTQFFREEFAKLSTLAHLLGIVKSFEELDPKGRYRRVRFAIMIHPNNIFEGKTKTTKR